MRHGLSSAPSGLPTPFFGTGQRLAPPAKFPDAPPPHSPRCWSAWRNHPLLACLPSHRSLNQTAALLCLYALRRTALRSENRVVNSCSGLYLIRAAAAGNEHDTATASPPELTFNFKPLILSVDPIPVPATAILHQALARATSLPTPLSPQVNPITLQACCCIEHSASCTVHPPLPALREHGQSSPGVALLAAGFPLSAASNKSSPSPTGCKLPVSFACRLLAVATKLSCAPPTPRGNRVDAASAQGCISLVLSPTNPQA